ncbi:hypothetical protein BDL97_11G041200 [Sphagnum fallax]|nr:hypothetical protein BDL97_11G041200 [Sphagnum fallax]KAH8947438.1 hypothetical protein BDL97_11G041200 [Sphagnum fallax]KAH8947439.1 hypothetical protein BDL97_11G041200 [Sphagnum fallax]
MLHHSARKLLARTHVLQCPFWSHEPLLNPVDSSAAAARVVSTLTSRTLDRDHSSNSDNVGYHWPITPRKGTSWRQQSYSTGFQKVGALQQGMAEMVSHVIPMPSDIRYADLIVKRSDHLQEKPSLDPLGLKFGALYTDHMLQVSWKEGSGWTAPSIDPVAPMTLHPCAQVLHYGSCCFEGMKAYKDKDQHLRLFRPDMNMDRLSRSAACLTLPEFDKVELLECIKELVRVERDWVPAKEGFSLYIRPTIIGTHPFLGLSPTREAMLFVVLSPVGPYFPGGLKPIKLFVETEVVRAYPGGVGDKKVGGNYAPTMLPQLRSTQRGCSQALYVLQDGHPGGGIVGESGAMNIFFLFQQEGMMELVTPPLNGLILPGVTRDTILTIARDFGNMKVSERLLRFGEIEHAAKTGRLLEVFGTGTACAVQPVTGLLKNDNTEITIPFDSEAAAHWLAKLPGMALAQPGTDEPFSLCGRLTRILLDYQYGNVESPWSVPIDP